MKALNEILKSVKIIQIKGDVDKYVSKICLSTDSVIKDCLFVAIKGNNTDGHNYIDKAISLGASVIPYHLKIFHKILIIKQPMY